MRVHISRFNKYMQTETSSEIYFFPLFFFFGQFTMVVFHFICMRMYMKIFCGMLFFGSKKNNSIQSSLLFTNDKCKNYQEKNNYLQEIIHVHVLHCFISS